VQFGLKTNRIIDPNKRDFNLEAFENQKALESTPWYKYKIINEKKGLLAGRKNHSDVFDASEMAKPFNH
jgi:hypothetical protein